MSESAVRAKRGWGYVWRETGAVRNARPSRGQAASTRKRAQWRKDGVAFRLRLLEGVTKDGGVGERQIRKYGSWSWGVSLTFRAVMPFARLLATPSNRLLQTTGTSCFLQLRHEE